MSRPTPFAIAWLLIGLIVTLADREGPGTVADIVVGILGAELAEAC